MANHTHIIECGSPELLPFARSRIKAIRATGLSYASQNFDMGDGRTVSIRVVGENSYIRIGASSGDFGMDTGIVDMGSTVVANPNYYIDGVLLDTVYSSAYNATFAPEPNHAGWKANPDKSSTGQYAGALSDKRGHLTTSTAARSFMALANKDNSDANDPETPTVRDATDANLVGKKTAAATCPPSVFTGRTRLYVQALYGAHLYKYDNWRTPTSSKATGVTNLSFSSVAGAPPYILISRVDPADPQGLKGAGNTSIMSGSGVHLDADGVHWMFSLTSTELVAYRLEPSKEAKQLRGLLKNASAADRIRIEAYILSTSRPSLVYYNVASLGGIFPTTSMGYSWHWNYSGTEATIIKHETFEQGSGKQGMRSTCYRLTMARLDTQVGASVTTTWKATVLVAEGPTDWACPRPNGIIAEPLSPTHALISVPYPQDMFACDGPIYAFYKGDLLVVFRYKYTLLDPTTSIEQSGPTYTSSAPQTKGLLGGYYSNKTTDGGSRNEIYSSDGFSTSYSVVHSTGGRDETYGHAMEPDFDHTHNSNLQSVAWTATGVWAVEGYGEPYYIPRFEAIYAPDPNNPGDSIAVGIVPGIQAWHSGALANITLDHETSTETISTAGSFDVIIPGDDAEAIFVHMPKSKTTNKSNRYVSHNRSDSHAASRELMWPGPAPSFTPYTFTFLDFFAQANAYGTTVLSTSTPPDSSVVVNTVSAYLVTSGKTLTEEDGVTFPNLAEYHNGAIDEAQPLLKCLSSADRLNQTVMSDRCSLHPMLASYPIIVGAT